MTALIDLNDVPQVAPKDLMRIMQKLIAAENGLIFLKGLTQETRPALEDAIWTTFAQDPERRLALLVRFECLIALFSSRRLKDQFTLHGLALLAPAFAVAARQRLNTTWGFNPQKFLTGLRENIAAPSKAAVAPRGQHQTPLTTGNVAAQLAA